MCIYIYHQPRSIAKPPGRNVASVALQALERSCRTDLRVRKEALFLTCFKLVLNGFLTVFNGFQWRFMVFNGS